MVKARAPGARFGAATIRSAPRRRRRHGPAIAPAPHSPRRRQPRQLVLQRRKPPRQPHPPRLERRRHRLGPPHLAPAGMDQPDRQPASAALSTLATMSPPWFCLRHHPVRAPSLRRRATPAPSPPAESPPRSHPPARTRPSAGEPAHHDPARIAAGRSRRIDAPPRNPRRKPRRGQSGLTCTTRPPPSISARESAPPPPRRTASRPAPAAPAASRHRSPPATPAPPRRDGHSGPSAPLVTVTARPRPHPPHQSVGARRRRDDAARPRALAQPHHQIVPRILAPPAPSLAAGHFASSSAQAK